MKVVADLQLCGCSTTPNGSLTRDLAKGSIRVEQNAQICNICAQIINVETIDIAGTVINSSTVNELTNIQGQNINNDTFDFVEKELLDVSRELNKIGDIEFSFEKNTKAISLAGFYAGKENNLLLFREIEADIPSGINVKQIENEIVLKSTIGVANIESGESGAADIYGHYDSSSTDFLFKQLVPGENITFTDSTDSITISSVKSIGFQGFQGQQGPQGPQGGRGLQDRLGFQGLQGFQGNQGRVGVSPFQLVGSLIRPISASTSAILAGFSNTISGTNNCIGGGRTSTVSGTRCATSTGFSNNVAGTDNAMLAGVGNVTSQSGGGVTHAALGGGTSNLIQKVNAGNVLYSAIMGGSSHKISHSGNSNVQGNAICGGNDHTLTGTLNAVVGGTTHTIDDTACAIIGGNTNKIIGPTVNNFIGGGTSNLIQKINATSVFYSTILGGFSHSITWSGNSDVDGNTIIAGYDHSIVGHRSAIIGGRTHSILSTTNGIIGGNSNQIAGDSVVISNFIGGGASNRIQKINNGTVFYGTILSGNNNTITHSNNSNISGDSILGGSSSTITSSNNSIGIGSSCSIGGVNNSFVWSDGAAATTGVTQSFRVGCAGGARFFSNTLRTTGVSLASNANAWAAISDRNLKENRIPLVHKDSLEKLKNIQVYQYNFIGNPADMICYGPMAQEWNPLFGCPLKAASYIDQGDVLGILLSSVKHLCAHAFALKEKVQYIKSRSS